MLVGTFALALAFAGNDLVNFIGVPIAAWQSYEAWAASGMPATEFAMAALARKLPTPTLFLLIAGLIMVLHFGFRARRSNVVKTSLDLSSQEDIKENFEPQFSFSVPGQSSFPMISHYTATVLPNSLIQTKLKNNSIVPVIDFPKEEARIAGV